MVVGGRMTPARLPGYLTGQFLGAFCVAAVLYGLFSPSIALLVCGNTAAMLRTPDFLIIG